MKSTITTAITIALTIIAGACSAPESPLPAPGRPLTGLTVDSLGIDIAPEQQREYSFTDKKAAFWYGLTHTNDWNDHYAGWNIAKRRLLSDYTLWADTSRLDRSFASVKVYPYKLTRDYPERAHEEFYMFDNIEALLIEVDHANADSIGISLSPRLLSDGRMTANGVEFTPAEAPTLRLNLQPLNDVPYNWDGIRMMTSPQSGGFIITCLRRSESADSAATSLRNNRAKLTQERKTRMDDISIRWNRTSPPLTKQWPG